MCSIVLGLLIGVRQVVLVLQICVVVGFGSVSNLFKLAFLACPFACTRISSTVNAGSVWLVCVIDVVVNWGVGESPEIACGAF